MSNPGKSLSEECFLEHLATPLFRNGVAMGWWDLCTDSKNEWPHVVIWLAAPDRTNGPERFYLNFNLSDYPTKGPTATLWDPSENSILDHSRWPKGVNDTAMVFRTDWENAKALYAPWDRIAMDSHGDWQTKHTSQKWKPSMTVVHYLRYTREALLTDDYHGC